MKETARALRLPPGTDEARFPAALMDTIGLETVQALDPEGRATVRFVARPEFTHSNGSTVQGGILTAWIDCAMAWAVAARDPAASFASLDIHVGFHARVGQGRWVVQARALKWGRRVAFLEADILGEDGRLMARASSSGMLG